MKGESRRDFLKKAARWSVLALLGGVAFRMAGKPGAGRRSGMVWQIDPAKCIQCGRCETSCVRTPSAVKCVHSYDICGFCNLCGGYHQPGAKDTGTGAENQLCPTDAIRRRFVEEPYFQYDIVEDLCIGCAKCVKGCAAFGNGSLFLQVRHDRCWNCNECSIARVCPSGAISRVPSGRPYRLRGQG